MKEKKGIPQKSTPGTLARTFHEILIADKRAYEPFVKVFRAEGENVSKLDLGTLVGVFEVDEKEEDAAYIVNFLASVAKKEYFNNPRRGPIESFEAALHKVNVALAELVKHGNVSWLGKLHGVLAVLEKNNLHFSVTGEAALLLLRQEQFSEISDGLASNEADVHPLKTFVEVSSGRLIADDTLILSTPELLALFPLDYLTKQAVRMKAQAFRQFLRTALVNEIDMAAVLAVELTVADQEIKVPSLKTKSESVAKQQTVANAFSQATFTPTKKPEPTPQEPVTPEDAVTLTKEEFIDEKTGHIYVQGDEMSDGASLRHSVVLESLHEMGSYVGELFSHTIRRQGKKTARLATFLLWESRNQTARLTRKAAQKISSLKAAIALRQQVRAAQKQRQLEKEARQETLRLNKAEEESIPVPEVTPLPPTPMAQREEVLTPPEPLTPITPKQATLPHIERFRSLYKQDSPASATPKIPVITKKTPKANALVQTNLIRARSLYAGFLPYWQKGFRNTLNLLGSTLQTLLRHKKWFLIGCGILVLVSGLGWWFLTARTSPKTADSNTPVAIPTSTPSTSTANSLHSESTLTLNQELVALGFLENQGYGATAKSIVVLDSKEEFRIPDIKGEVRFLAPMEDLRLIFILTSQNELFAWSPLAKTFTKQELTLPANARVTGIGTYLTYLYVLDRGNNQLYRYPRSTPGFTEPANWMKESFELTDTAFLAINETVALAPSREHLLSFSQGKSTGDFIFQNPDAPINIQALTTDSDKPFIYALDNKNTLSIWNLDRKLLHTYTLQDAPKDALYLASDPEKNTLLVGNKEGTITRYTNVTSE